MGRKLSTGSGIEAELGKHPGVEIHGNSLRISFSWKRTRHRETLGLPPTKANIKHAAQKRAAVLHAIKIGTFNYADEFPESKHAGARGGVSSLRLREAANIYGPLKAVDITPDTEARYRHAMAASVASVGPDRLVSSLLPRDMQQLRADLISTRKPSTVNHYLSIFAGLMRWCESNGYAAEGLADTCTKFSLSIADPDPLTRDEFDLLISKGCRHEQDKASITLMVYTGLRPGELCGLAVEDVDLKTGSIRVARSITSRGTFKVPKTTMERTVLLLPPAVEAIKTLIRLAKGNPVFSVTVDITRHQSRIDVVTPLLSPKLRGLHKKINDWYKPTSWNAKWRQIQERAKIRPRRPYQTRHTFACWCITAHGNLAFIAKQMGHKDFTMLIKVYGKWMEDASEGEVTRIWNNMTAAQNAPNLPQG